MKKTACIRCRKAYECRWNDKTVGYLPGSNPTTRRARTKTFGTYSGGWISLSGAVLFYSVGIMPIYIIVINWIQELHSSINYVWARVLTMPHSHSAGFDAGMGSLDDSWTALRGLWWSAVRLCGWEHTPVSSATQRQPGSAATSRPDPMARDAVVQRRLLAEPKTPFLLQIYSSDLLVQQLQSPVWLFLIVWLFYAAVFFLLFLEGKDIIIQPHLFNCSDWSHSNWVLPFICNGNDYEIVCAV